MLASKLSSNMSAEATNLNSPEKKSQLTANKFNINWLGTVPSPRGGFGGLSPPNQSTNPPQIEI